MYVLFIAKGVYTVDTVQEAKKVLFYYPTDVELDTKIRQIGLCEAVIKFTRYVICLLSCLETINVKDVQ